MLDIQNLLVQRGEGAAAHRVRLPVLKVAAGEILAITGESGCGKSTLLEAIGLLLAPSELGLFRLGSDGTRLCQNVASEGSTRPKQAKKRSLGVLNEHFSPVFNAVTPSAAVLTHAGLDVAQLLLNDNQAALADVRSRYLGFVLQSGGLLPFLKVRDNINLPRRLLGMPAQSAQVERAVKALRLEGLLDKLPQALSIGERQRVACVRAIAHEPKLLLADEPTAALDPHSARRLFELLLELVGELGLSALVVSHDWALVRDFGLPRLGAISHAGETRFEAMD